MRPPPLVALALTLLPSIAIAQSQGVPAGMPLVVDMRKIDIGSWAEYKMSMGTMTLTSRWALVARDAKSNTLELTSKGGPVAKPVVLRMVLPADPTSDDKPPRPMVVQFGDDRPMYVPKDTPTQKFQRADDKNLVAKEEIKVAAGAFKTSHYREKNTNGAVDIWVNETVYPLGIVRVITTPEVDENAPAAMQVPSATMELLQTGKGAKPTVTRKPRPFDEKKMGGLVGR
ncbi:MAG: hypothetical protein JXP73_13255 [Deltaproteobacteria bacterium]|jgi:hypothetical protein|nr:hypothetical protein [Deltaproteobacteria bacterium]